MKVKIIRVISLISLLLVFVVGSAQTIIWSEDFSGYTDPSGKKIETSGIIDVGDYPTSVSKWTLDVSALATDGNTDWFYVTNNEFSAKDLDAEAIWTSESITISGYSNIKLSVDLAENGDMENNDYFKVYYKLDGGAETQFAVNGYVNDDFTSATAEQTGLSGTSVVIIIKCKNSADDEFHTFDNVKVIEMTSNSTQSDIVKKSGWSEPTNIDYTSYSASNSLTTTNSIEVAKFTIRDGGGSADADIVSTTLTALDFTVLQYQNLAALAIFSGTTKVAEVASFPSSTVTFSGFNLEALDGNTEDFTLRATFNTAVTDNVNLKYTISSATADISGSGFAASDAGGAATDNNSNNNKLVVTADRLMFTSNKPPSSVHINTDFEVEVKAVDANDNVDLDATNSITLAKALGTGTLSSTIGLTQSLVAGTYSWTDVQYDVGETFKIEAQTAILTKVTSHNIISSIRAWINEFHYDNAGTDSDEFVEICIENASGFDLSYFTITLYNGGNSSSYNTKTLDVFTAGSTYDDITVYYFDYPVNGIQNGAPDGIALSYDDGSKMVTLLEFISYEGDFTATNGPASGITSTDVIVKETDTSPVGETIQRYGDNDDWNWASGVASTKGTKNNNQVLPIELLSFTANNQDKAILINWQTATETNNDFFTLERSVDAEHFEVISIIMGAGNSNSINYYEYMDNVSNEANTLYYRLKQTDFDGNNSYSELLSVTISKEGVDIIRTFTQHNLLQLNIYSAEPKSVRVYLYDVMGKTLLQRNLDLSEGENIYRINTPRLSNGVYILQIMDNQMLEVKKLLIHE